MDRILEGAMPDGSEEMEHGERRAAFAVRGEVREMKARVGATARRLSNIRRGRHVGLITEGRS